MSENSIHNVIIIGGGLVGSLCGNFMAKRGYQVTLYESRNGNMIVGRSINLALSNRGRRSLSFIGLEDRILESAVPMKGRFIHEVTGKTRSILYDRRTNQCIYSVGRNYLNKLLLAALESYPNVKICFNHKLVSANLDEGTITVQNMKSNGVEVITADLIIGADGAYSTLRRTMQQTSRFEFSQHYIEHGYLELTIPAANSDRMISNHLHIWPRGQFMMIALPNQDKSWTVTLFMPFSRFERLTNDTELLDFFNETFPDSVPLIGEKVLVDSFFGTKPSSLVSIKCHPYHAGAKFLLIGDSAHAMVPFYGQGMNAGFEDCFILNAILDENDDDIERSIKQFSAQRKEDAYAICDLAVYNYIEMRDLVTRRSYYFRKIFDESLSKVIPNKWIPLYNAVTFSYVGYKQCIEHRKWQDMVLTRLIWTGLTLIVCLAVIYKTSLQ